ncbi:RAB26 protein, partial [Chauna torquata]|nr:RAB26 protein [Chauna torquata]
QTILVGDSGVGKTSLLVQFDQGKFIPGSFSATVGIGFTVSPGCQGWVTSLAFWGAVLFGPAMLSVESW